MKVEKKKNGDAPQEPKTDEKAVVKWQKDIGDKVMARVNELEAGGGLKFPKNYSPPNAIKSAWLHLQMMKDRSKKPILPQVTQDSVVNSLLDMVIQGLSCAKNQCYFIKYADQLTLMRSYHGTIKVTKGIEGIKDVFAQIIYEGDEFAYTINPETSLISITKHEQDWKNIDLEKITGAYSVVIREGDLTNYVTVMNMKQIRDAWSQGAAGGTSPAHKKFPDEMAKKTAINRGCKAFLNASDDSDIMIGAVNRTTANEYLNDTPYEEQIEDEIDENANQELLDVGVPDNEPTENDERRAEINNSAGSPPAKDEEEAPGY